MVTLSFSKRYGFKAVPPEAAPGASLRFRAAKADGTPTRRAGSPQVVR